ncbi:hypothetical protein VTJ83DRAFT_2519 [Remersonia thermophila]|uniref:Uncharacterized protein n=1 Tax=Remersonia thermophila TaxID=72144 RepID=A0ABR4DIY7_9PEZI
MDDTKRLVSHLQDELARLDNMVAAYQREMLVEFQKHMSDCLKDCPDDVSRQVSQAIAEAMASGTYAALCPPVSSAPGTPIIDHSAWDGRTSPPPHLPGTPRETARDIREREEEEFHELFTPRYLPLLEDKESRRRRRSPSVSSTGSVSLPAPAMADGEPNGGSKQPAPDEASLDNVRPQITRSSSASSATSDSKSREGALRRSSVGSAKDSPRRVRFLVGGHEVFPSSPKPQETAESGAGERMPEAEPSEALSVADETDAFVGSSLAEEPGEEDFLPKPKKVSSTQKLRELSRQPLDDSCDWVPSGGGHDDPPAKPNGAESDTSPQRAPAVGAEDQAPRNSPPAPPLEETTANDFEGDFLTMAPKGKLGKGRDKDKHKDKGKGPASSSSETRGAPAQPATKAALTINTNGKLRADDRPEDDHDDDALFDLDEETRQPGDPPSKPVKKYLADPDSDDETPKPKALLAHRRRPTPTDALPPVSPSAALFGHSIGSYKGRTVLSTPIKNPKLYDEIAGMKDVHFFVGSIDGRSGVEPADLGSYRAASLARANAAAGGVPRSFSERLALEEEMERRIEEEGAEEGI